MKLFALAALLVFATTATASDRCVFYISGVKIQPMESATEVDRCESGGCTFTSFNPRTHESVSVAKIEFVPHQIIWQKDFGALTYLAKGKAYRLNWKLGAVPIPISASKKPHPPVTRIDSRQTGKVWNPDSPDMKCDSPRTDDADVQCKVAVDVPPHREIDVGVGEGDSAHFLAPVTWVNHETGKTRVLHTKEDAEYLSGFDQVDISTADTFILIGTEYDGMSSVVADLNTGETVMKAGNNSMLAKWTTCPSK